MLGVQMMQEWLGQHKLDRKALAALASNAQAVQAYEDYLHNQVQDIMEDLLAEFDEPAPAQGTHSVSGRQRFDLMPMACNLCLM